MLESFRRAVRTAIRTANLPICIPYDAIPVIEVSQTETYAQWFEGLRDRQARACIDARIRRPSPGNSGGDKRTQDRDIKTAIALARGL